VFTYEVPSTTQSTQTVVVDGEFTKLPAETTTETLAKATKTNSQSSVTLVQSSAFSSGDSAYGFYTVTSSATVSSFYTLSGAASGLLTLSALTSFTGTTSVTSTAPFATYAVTSTSETSERYSFARTYISANSVTTFDTREHGVTTAMATGPINWVIAPSGVWGGSSVGVYYSASVSMSLMDEMSVKHSRGIVTAWPSVYLAERGGGSTTGTLTLSGLNATYRFGTDTSTRTMSLTQAGTPQTTTVASNSSVQGGVLGDLETKWEWTPAGAYRVYAGTGTSTMSTTGGWSSFSGSKTTRFLEPLSYIVAGTGDAIWTAQRNSTTYPAS